MSDVRISSTPVPAPLHLFGGHADPPCFLESLAETARLRMNAVAVVDQDRQISYGGLLRWSHLIAERLAEQGVARGDRVAVRGSRGTPVVAAMLAVTRLGATYVPLDDEYPRKRIDYMLRNSDVKIVLSTRDTRDDAGVASTAPSLLIPGPPEPDNQRGTPFGPAGACEQDLPTYLIYTSGSTGRPKGVAIPHSCLDNMVEWQRGHSVSPDVRTAQFAPMNFDVFFQEVLGTLCGGGTLIIVPEGLRRDPIRLLSWLAETGVERLFLPCVALNMLAVAASAVDDLGHLALREINTAGEQLVCTPAMREFFDRLPGCRLNNHYGQSESAMVTAYTLQGPSSGWPTLPPIGTPLPGCALMVEPTDPDEPTTGELLVAGLPLSAGYLDQPVLSAERYVTIDPTPQGHTRAFRTGDLVRVDGELVYWLSRNDHEVKIRGVRVNPLEVEGCLLEQQGVLEAVCVDFVMGEGSRQLHAAITTGSDHRTTTAELHAAITELLPPQSLPLSITVVPDLPRTPSGKTDRERVARSLRSALQEGI